MPLIHSPSKKNFVHNVKTEQKSGKPMKQSLAIAYNTKRLAQKKKMAHGGRVENEDLHPEHSGKNPMPMDGIERLSKEKQAHDHPMAEPKEPKRFVKPAPSNLPQNMAKGGMIKDCYAEGGEVLDDDFLTAQEMGSDQDAIELGEQTYPDAENTEHEIFPPAYSGESREDEMDPSEKRKGLVSKILYSIRMKNMGK